MRGRITYLDSSVQVLDLGGRSAVTDVLDAISGKELRSLIPVKRG